MRASNHRTFPIMPIALESPDQPDVIALIAELDAYQDTLYPPESRHIFDLAGLKQPNVLFAVARDAVGVRWAARRSCSSRIWRAQADVCQSRRQGRGLARQLLSLLETSAVSRGCKLLRLETGPYQQEALALYASAGFERRGPFGDYVDDPLSVFMQKRVALAGPRLQ